ncbi:hypothetical protein D3C87_1890850 [compost metagenome]
MIWLKICALPSNLPISALLLCIEVSACWALNAAIISSRLASNTLICSGSVAIAANPCIRARTLCSKALILPSTLLALPD